MPSTVQAARSIIAADPLYKAARLREAAAKIIRHCKTEGFSKAEGIGTAWLRGEPYYEDAGAMLARRGYGTLARATVAGRGNTFVMRRNGA